MSLEMLLNSISKTYSLASRRVLNYIIIALLSIYTCNGSLNARLLFFRIHSGGGCCFKHIRAYLNGSFTQNKKLIAKPVTVRSFDKIYLKPKSNSVLEMAFT